MRILFDHNVPRALRRRLPGHEVSTTKREGWDELLNGRLLDAAEQKGFDLLITRDQGFAHQQNMRERRIAVALLVDPRQDERTFVALIDTVAGRLASLAPGTVAVVVLDDGETPPPLVR